MTRNYIYIEAGREIDMSSRFFRVSIGTNKQANRDYLFLLAWATDHNYFREVSCEEHQRDLLDSAYYSMKKLARNLTLPSGKHV